MQSPEAPSLAAAIVSDRCHLRIPSRLEWIDLTVSYLHQKACESGLCGTTKDSALALALREALLNAVIHGNLEVPGVLLRQGEKKFAESLAAHSANPYYADRTVDIIVDNTEHRCQWTITDQGRGFDIKKVLREYETGFVGEASTGRGILIMRAIMHEVRYEENGRRLVLTFQKVPRTVGKVSLPFSFENPIEVFPIDAAGTVDYDHNYDAVCHDLSESGMAMLQSQPPATDRVIIGVICDGKQLFLPAKIKGRKQVQDELHEVTCQFETPLDPDLKPQVSKLGLPADLTKARKPGHGSSASLSPVSDRRRYTRVIYTERVGIQVDGSAEPVQAYARDLSKGGIALITVFPLAVDENRVVTLPLPQGSKLRMQTRIVRCTEIAKGFYDIAGQFVSADAAGAEPGR